MSKLSWEYSSLHDDAIIIKKAKGKLTVGEIMEFMKDREQIMNFGEGTLCVIAFRNYTDGYDGWELETHQGDEQEVFILDDETRCFCGQLLHYQYCPDCGRNLLDYKR